MKFNEKNLIQSPFIIVLRAPSQALAIEASKIIIQSGVKFLEITFSTPNAPEVISKLKKDYPEVSIGCGSISNIKHAELAYEAKADFYISPHFDLKISNWFKENQIENYIPGGITPTELMNISKQWNIQKLFPANLYGAKGIKGILAPLPQLNLIVTGGVNLETASSFINSGALAICAGSSIFKDFDWQKPNWSILKSNLKQWESYYL